MRLDGRTGRPRLECLFGLPLRHHEVAVLALDRAQQLKAQKTGLVVDGVRAVREPFLQFRTGVGRDLDCVDLHHGHAVQATELAVGIVGRHYVGMQCLTAARRRGRAAGARARPDGAGQHLVAAAAVADPARGRCTPTTRRGTAAATSTIRIRSAPSGSSPTSATRSRRWAARAVMVGHSMGALHSWCLAATPARAGQCARRRGHGAGLPRSHHRPVGAVAARAAGRIRFGAKGLRRVRTRSPASTSSRRSTGPRPAGGCTGTRRPGSRSPPNGAPATTGSSGRRCGLPSLLMEAGNSVTPLGQMRRMAETGHRTTYLHVPGAGHLIHDDAPQIYRGGGRVVSSDARPIAA